MVYDFGLRKISELTHVTGIEAKNISKALKKKGIDYQKIDWETIGSDLYGHGSRSGGVKHHLRHMYGIDISTPQTRKHEGQREHASLNSLVGIFERRSRLSKKRDLQINARRTFKHTNIAGVKLWKKNPNRYDIEGVDDSIKF